MEQLEHFNKRIMWKQSMHFTNDWKYLMNKYLHVEHNISRCGPMNITAWKSVIAARCFTSYILCTRIDFSFSFSSSSIWIQGSCILLSYFMWWKQKLEIDIFEVFGERHWCLPYWPFNMMKRKPLEPIDGIINTRKRRKTIRSIQFSSIHKE